MSSYTVSIVSSSRCKLPMIALKAWAIRPISEGARQRAHARCGRGSPDCGQRSQRVGRKTISRGDLDQNGVPECTSASIGREHPTCISTERETQADTGGLASFSSQLTTHKQRRTGNTVWRAMGCYCLGTIVRVHLESTRSRAPQAWERNVSLCRCLLVVRPWSWYRAASIIESFQLSI